GDAIPECAFASALSIPFSNVTLVDRKIDPEIQQLLHPGIQTVRSGLFTYLRDTTAKFGFITMIGGDYIVYPRNRLETLIELLSRVTEPGALVCVETDLRNDPTLPWQTKGFTSPDDHYDMLKVFSGQA
ncbi:MAG: hypothetical protein AAB803_00275, partial [Patescibacteria group bacterium]